YIYTGEIDFDVEQGLLLIDACKRFDLPILSIRALLAIETKLTAATACLYLPRVRSLEDIRDRVVNLVRFHATEALKSAHFNGLDADTLMWLVKDDFLDVDEFVLYERLVEWLECRKQSGQHDKSCA
ncbi:BTB/POZ domain-containing protein 6, partial [Aphelenchoides avenae]